MLDDTDFFCFCEDGFQGEICEFGKLKWKVMWYLHIFRGGRTFYDL